MPNAWEIEELRERVAALEAQVAILLGKPATVADRGVPHLDVVEHLDGTRHVSVSGPDAFIASFCAEWARSKRAPWQLWAAGMATPEAVAIDRARTVQRAADNGVECVMAAHLRWQIPDLRAADVKRAQRIFDRLQRKP